MQAEVSHRRATVQRAPHTLPDQLPPDFADAVDLKILFPDART